MEIVYYETLKELPGAPIGSQVTIINGGKTGSILQSKISFPIETIIEFKDWFRPIPKEDHIKIMRENILKIIIEHGHTREHAYTILRGLK